MTDLRVVIESTICTSINQITLQLSSLSYGELNVCKTTYEPCTYATPITQRVFYQQTAVE